MRTYNPKSPCDTPNIESLAAPAHVFDNHFVGSMPARRELIAGRREFMWRPWGPLEVFDPRLLSEVKTGGYHTHVVTDHYHYWEEEANGFIQSYDTTEMIRGYEVDHWQAQDPNEENRPGSRRSKNFALRNTLGNITRTSKTSREKRNTSRRRHSVAPVTG